MSGILGALIPVFIVILLGYVFRRTRIISDAFWEPAERVTFYLFFPALLVANAASADLGGLDVWPMLAALVGGILLVVASNWLLRRPLGLDGPKFTSLIQGSVRPNVYVGVAAAVALYGDAGLTAVSLCIAVAVPLVNFISVVALITYASPAGRPRGWRAVVVPVLQNPLIVACLLGLALNVTGIGLPPLIGPTLEILGRASLPIALLAVGAGLDLAAVRLAGRTVAVTTTLKLAVLPVVTVVLCLILGVDGVDGVEAAVAILYASLPGSASAYVMARQMGGDAPIMAGVITATTLAAIVTIPVVLIVFV